MYLKIWKFSLKSVIAVAQNRKFIIWKHLVDTIKYGNLTANKKVRVVTTFLINNYIGWCSGMRILPAPCCVCIVEHRYGTVFTCETDDVGGVSQSTHVKIVKEFVLKVKPLIAFVIRLIGVSLFLRQCHRLPQPAASRRAFTRAGDSRLRAADGGSGTGARAQPVQCQYQLEVGCASWAVQWRLSIDGEPGNPAIFSRPKSRRGKGRPRRVQ